MVTQEYGFDLLLVKITDLLLHQANLTQLNSSITKLYSELYKFDYKQYYAQKAEKRDPKQQKEM